MQREAKDGFPSIAELASKKDWALLQNLCRRRVITSKEANKVHDGKTALLWDTYHGEYGLARELCYLLVRIVCRLGKPVLLNYGHSFSTGP